MAREVIYGLSIRTDRTDRKSSIRSVKNFLRSVNCIFISGAQNIFMAREVICGLLIRTDCTDRKSGIRSSVKNFVRSVNCISLVGFRIFSWQERSYTVCRSVRTAKVVFGP